MAGDEIAGDDHAAKQGGADPAAALPKSVETKPIETGSLKSFDKSADTSSPKPVEAGTSPVEMTPSPALAEWTASDTRGRLNEAGSIPERDRSSPEAEPLPSRASAAPAAGASAGSAEPLPAARRASLWPVALGLVAGAVIGAGSAYLVYANAAGNDGADAKIAALANQVAALEKRPDPQAPVAALKASVADLSGKVAALEKAPARPASPAAPNQASPNQASPSQAGAGDAADLQQKVAALQASVAAVQRQSASASDLTALGGKLAAVTAGVADVQKQTAASRADVQALQSGQKSLEGKVTSSPALAVVADSLVQQIGRGLPFAAQVNALEALGVDPAKIAILRQFADAGVPTATALAAKFEPLTDGLLAAGNRAPAGAGLWERLKSGASGLVSIHRVDAVSGDDVPSRVARIRADLQRDDVIDAVKTWGALPADAKVKPEAAAWGALAKTHAAAMEAANAVEHDAIAALATKKS